MDGADGSLLTASEWTPLTGGTTTTKEIDRPRSLRAALSRQPSYSFLEKVAHRVSTISGQASSVGQTQSTPTLVWDAEHKSMFDKIFENIFGHSAIKHHKEFDPMRYRIGPLSRWSALIRWNGTVLENRNLWYMAALSLLLSTVIAVLVLVLVPDPGALQLAKFQMLGTFLNVFVGLMLGFFLSSSITRWYACADGFLELFDAVRNLQMQFHALGVTDESEALCLRYGMLSGWLLSIEIHISHMPLQKQAFVLDKLWEQMKNSRPGLLEPDEEEMLLQTMWDHGEPSGLVWIWVASKVGSMSELHEIPPCGSPTYGRVLNIVQDAYGGIRSVRGSITVQAPFIYVHMLSALVHLNNIINAGAWGLTLGCFLGTCLQASKLPGVGYVTSATTQDVNVDIQNVIITFFISFVGPCVYHALLEVAICIAQPFEHEVGRIPTARMLSNLEKDLQSAKQFSNSPMVTWPHPNYASTVKAV